MPKDLKNLYEYHCKYEFRHEKDTENQCNVRIIN